LRKESPHSDEKGESISVNLEKTQMFLEIYQKPKSKAKALDKGFDDL
jgi:hypothetical protein